MAKKQARMEIIENLLKDAYSLGYETGYFDYDSKNDWAVEQIEKLNKEAAKVDILPDVVKRFKSGKEAGEIARENENKEKGNLGKKHKTKYMEDEKEEKEKPYNPDIKEDMSSFEMPTQTLKPGSDSKPTSDELPAMLKKHHMVEDKPTDV